MQRPRHASRRAARGLSGRAQRAAARQTLQRPPALFLGGGVTHIRDLIRRDVSAAEHDQIRELWKRHSIAEDERDLAGLISTLTDDCVYELAQTGHRWEGHEGAARFYGELLTAFPDIHFDLTDIVIGPQGVCEEADVVGTHEAAWLGAPPSRERLAWKVVIFFPWDREKRLFRGEKVYTAGLPLGELFAATAM